MPRATKATGTKTSSVKAIQTPKGLSLDLEAQVFKSIDKLIPAIEDTVAVREFGIKVTRETVARIALLRGLALMGEADNCGMPQPALKPPSKAVKATEAPKPEASTDRSLNVDGTIRTPEGWRRWGKKENLPEQQSEIHAYYTSNGWDRYWGRTGDEVIAFYWANTAELQDLEMYDNVDANGKRVLLQETPYGPGHVVPHGWTC